MRAIILAAGIGYRLLPVTEEIPKCLVPVAGRSIIARAVDALVHNGIRDIVVVIGYKKEMIKNALLADYKDAASFTFVENDIFDKTNNIYSLWLASKWFDDDIILLESDIVFEPGILAKLIASESGNVMVVDDVDGGSDGTVVRVDEDRNVYHLMTKEHLQYPHDRTDLLKTVNIYKFSRAFLEQTFYPVLKTHIESRSYSKYYELVLGIIIYLDRPHLKALPVDGGKWYEIDTYPDLVRADYLFSSQTRRLSTLEESWGGHWHYTGFTDFMFMGNPWFPPESFVRSMGNRLESLIRSYGSTQRLLNKKAAMLEYLREDFFFLFSGASQAIAFLATLAGSISIPVPTFQEYINRFDPEAVHLHRLPVDTFACDPVKLAEGALAASSDTLVIVNPNNPSAGLIEKEKWTALLGRYAEMFRFIIVDESFIDFADPGHSLKAQAETFPNLVIVKSMGKAYGISGLRLGYIYSASAVIKDAFEKYMPIWNINSPAEFFIEEALKYRDAYRESLAMVKNDRDDFRQRLEKIPCLNVFSSHANFLMVEINRGFPLSAGTLKEHLFSRHALLVKDLTPKIRESHPGYAGNGFLRFAVLKKNDNDRLIEGLKDVIADRRE